MAGTQQARDGTSDGGRPGPRRPGRPRNASYDKIILDATLEILVARGYSGLTIEGVAARTGVGLPTIYRRWPTKAALAIAALDALGGRLTQPTAYDSGNLRDDLRAFQRERIAQMNLPAFRAIMAGLMSESTTGHELISALEPGIQRRQAAVSAALQRGVDRGELRPGVDFELVNDLLVGPLFLKSVLLGQRLRRGLADQTVDAVLAAFGTGC